MSSWFDLISFEMKEHGDSFDNLVASTLTDKELHRKFDSGFGRSEGVPFTLWTKGRVYFPAVYDGAEWVASVSRDSDGIPTFHIGGE